MRYIPITQADKEAMLRDIGVSSTDELFADIPPAVRLDRPLNLPVAQSEMEILANFRIMTGKNANMIDNACFLGCGAYDHYIPAMVDYLLQRVEFLTAYTPYQPEISQGTLQHIWEYQSLVSELTGLPVVSASHYDGGAATAEAALMTCRATRRERQQQARRRLPRRWLDNSCILCVNHGDTEEYREGCETGYGASGIVPGFFLSDHGDSRLGPSGHRRCSRSRSTVRS